MNNLLRSVVLRNKDSLLKESLQSQLITCVKDVQLDHAHSGRYQSSFETAEALCTVLEAIFIHGIKETFADKMAIAMGDPDTRPEPNFWPALLVFSHRELIDQIAKLNFISTEIGRCRAWLRIALNDTLLTSYLQSMVTQNRALSSFYKRSAYLRDTELLDTSITVISGIEVYSFNLVFNSSLLNMWTNQPLLMSGVWSPAIKSYPITSGTDIAHTLMVEESKAAGMEEDTVSSVLSVASMIDSSLGSNAFDEEEALKIILGTDVTNNLEESETQEIEKDFVNNQETGGISPEIEVSPEIVAETTSIVEVGIKGELPEKDKIYENSLPERKNKIEELVNYEIKTEHAAGTQVEKVYKRNKIQSYHSLVESYNQTLSTASKVPDLQELLQKFHKPAATNNIHTGNDSEVIDDLDFEVVTDHSETVDIPEFGSLLKQISKIATEKGLDSQNYKCKSCSQHVGINFCQAKVCGYSGAYYCSGCFGCESNPEYSVIPARIIYNWDFREYSVSHNTANFLNQIQLYPLFDLSIMNPKIYSAVEEMVRLKELRLQLVFLRAYLATCRENVLESLQKLLWPRDYLYENIHHYSLADLMQVPTGVLETLLRKALNIGRSHILSCILCYQKGFICEICNSSKVIFPFDLDTTFRCKDCYTVYHAECLQVGQLCQKCSRIQQREESQEESTFT